MAFVDTISRFRSSDNRWKPYQTGIITTYNTILLAEELLNNRSLQYFLCSRLTQDAPENIFSLVRSRGSLVPSALQALRVVRLITIAQFTKDVKGGNYLNDNDSHYLDFLQSPVKIQRIRMEESKD